MHIFDCDTQEVALRSMSLASGLDEQDVLQRLRRAEFDPDHDVDELLEAFDLSFDAGVFTGTRCYHYSRCLDPDRYLRRGLAPLSSAAIADVWDDIQSALRLDVDWTALRQEFVADTSYSRRYLVERALRPKADGPWAFYTRQLAFRNINAHYFDGAEFGVDSLLWLQSRLRDPSLSHRYKEATTPCIVHFVVEGVPMTAQRCALTWLYSAVKDSEPWAPEYCFDGGGQVIAANTIERVERLSDEDIGRDAEPIDPSEFRPLSMVVVGPNGEIISVGDHESD